jgi:hypothetical protein
LPGLWVAMTTLPVRRRGIRSSGLMSGDPQGKPGRDLILRG